MTTRSTPASSIIGSARSMVNGSGNCGLAPGSQGQSGEFAFQKCTWASTIVRLLAGCESAFCALVASAAPAISVVPNLRRVSMMGMKVLPAGAALWAAFRRLEDCNLGAPKRNPGARSFDHGNSAVSWCVGVGGLRFAHLLCELLPDRLLVGRNRFIAPSWRAQPPWAARLVAKGRNKAIAPYGPGARSQGVADLSIGAELACTPFRVDA